MPSLYRLQPKYLEPYSTNQVTAGNHLLLEPTNPATNEAHYLTFPFEVE